MESNSDIDMSASPYVNQVSESTVYQPEKPAGWSSSLAPNAIRKNSLSPAPISGHKPESREQLTPESTKLFDDTAQEDHDMGLASEPTPKEWVRLQSADGFSYIVKRKVGLASGTLRNMLDPDGGYAEALTHICGLPERGIIVEKLVEYMAFKSYYEANSKEDVPVNEFLERIPPEIVLELLLAADYQEL